MATVTLTVIGTVRNGRTSAEDAGWGSLESTIELEPRFAEGLGGLETFSHAVVLFHLHQDPDGEAETLVRRPRGRADAPRLGVFAQRGRMRPNKVGITTVRVLSVEPGRVRVRGLDALDGTPVLDLKPYVPAFDRPADPRVPDWVERLMEGYFT